MPTPIGHEMNLEFLGFQSDLRMEPLTVRAQPHPGRQTSEAVNVTVG